MTDERDPIPADSHGVTATPTTDSESDPATPRRSATNDAATLQSLLDGRWADLRNSLRRELDPDLFSPLHHDATLEQHRAITLRRLGTMASTMRAHDALSGTSAESSAKLAVASEVIAHANLSLFVKSGVQFGLFAGVIQNLGTQRHHDELLPRALDCSLLGCFAMTEIDHGSDVQALGTTATYDPESDEIVVTTPDPGSRKEFIGNAARDGRMAAVFAQLHVGDDHHGVHSVLVPIRDDDGQPMPGVTIEDCGAKLGLPGVDNGRLGFDHVRVPRTNLLDRYGTITAEGRYESPIESRNRRFFTMLGTLVRGRISVGGAAGAAARSGLALAVRHALGRRQFANPLAAPDDTELLLLDYQSHQLKLLPLVARSYAFALAQNDLVADLARGESGALEDDDHDRRELEARAAGLKAVQTRHATETLQVCREACGGAGYMAVNRFADLKADTDVFTTFEGDNTVLLQLVGKSLLTRYQRDVAELDTAGIARFVARQVTGAMIERTGSSGLTQRLISGARLRDGDPLGDRGSQLALIEDRERHLLDTLASRLRKAPTDPLGAARVYNLTQDHLISTAEAHMERIALEAMVEAIHALDQEPGVADLLCDLYVVDLVHRHRAWYLEHGRLSSNQAKEVVRRRSDLCAELRPYASILVDAFAIPAAWLDNELATPADATPPNTM